MTSRADGYLVMGWLLSMRLRLYLQPTAIINLINL